MEGIKTATDEMRIYPLQVNDSKCGFGHFYHSLKISNTEIKEDWDSIDAIHHELHDYGQKIIKALEENKSAKLKEYYDAAERLSHDVLNRLDKVAAKVKELDKRRVHVLGS